MKKRDRPLVGDSPARIRVPMVGTVSLGGVVAVANGRCGISESSPGRPLRKAVCGASPGIKSGAGSVVHRAQVPPPTGVEEKTCATRVGLGEEGWKPAGEPGGGGNAPRAGRCLMERSAGASSRKKAQEGDAPGSRQGTEAPRLPHESSTVACATTAPGHSPVRAEGKPSPRASAPGGCAPRRPCRAATASPGPPRPPASRRFRWAPGRRPVIG